MLKFKSIHKPSSKKLIKQYIVTNNIYLLKIKIFKNERKNIV